MLTLLVYLFLSFDFKPTDVSVWWRVCNYAMFYLIHSFIFWFLINIFAHYSFSVIMYMGLNLAFYFFLSVHSLWFLSLLLFLALLWVTQIFLRFPFWYIYNVSEYITLGIFSLCSRYYYICIAYHTLQVSSFY